MPIILDHVTHTYMPGSPFQSIALGDVSFECFMIHQLVIRIYLLFNQQIVTPGIRERLFCAISCFVISVGTALYINKRPRRSR